MQENLTQLNYLFELAQSFDKNMNTNFNLSMAPGIVTIGGALFWHLGIASSILFNFAGLIAGSGNATYPLLKKHLEKTQEAEVIPIHLIENDNES